MVAPSTVILSAGITNTLHGRGNDVVELRGHLLTDPGVHLERAALVDAIGLQRITHVGEIRVGLRVSRGRKAAV